MTTVVGGKATAMVTATLPANASPSDPWVGFGAEACNFGVGIMCLPTGVIGVPPTSNISCQSAGNCTAVGTYTDTAGNMDGVMFTETDGVWATGVQAQVPPALMNVPAGSDTQLRFVSVQCVAAGNCTAVADLSGFSFSGKAFPIGSWMLVGGEMALAFTETNGVWSQGAELPPPAGAGTAPTYTSVASLSCPDAGDCVAVASSSNGPYVVTESGGVWAPGTTVSPPSEPNGSWGMRLDAVSCPQVGDCTVVGGLNVATSPSTDYPEPVAVSESNGVWSPATTLNVPANAWPATEPLPDVGVESVLDLLSCPSAGNCTAAGDYVDASGIPQGLFVNESGGTWLTGVQAQQPANPGNYNTVSMTQLSCASAGDCAATGQETEIIVSNGGLGGIGANADTGLLFSETNGTWTTGSVPQLPSNASQAAPPVVGAISCSSSSGCIAAGTYDATAGASVATAAAAGSAAGSGGLEAYVVRRTAAGWSQATELTPPAPTRGQILDGIRTLLSADRRSATAARGHKRSTIAARSYSALEAGRITLRWSVKVERRSVLVAQAAAKIAKPTRIKLNIRVTRAGAALMSTSRAIRVTDQATFKPVGSATVRASDSFKLAGSR